MEKCTHNTGHQEDNNNMGKNEMSITNDCLPRSVAVLLIVCSSLIFVITNLPSISSSSHLIDYNQHISSSTFGEPVFRLEPPSVISYLNSQGTTLLCLASGSPQPSITWYTSASGYDSTSQLSALSGESALEQSRLVTNISNLRLITQNGAAIRLFPFESAEYRSEVHSAEYRCVASNSIATIHSRSALVQAVLADNHLSQVSSQSPRYSDNTDLVEIPASASSSSSVSNLAQILSRPRPTGSSNNNNDDDNAQRPNESIRVADEFVLLGSPAVLRCKLAPGAATGSRATDSNNNNNRRQVANDNQHQLTDESSLDNGDKLTIEWFTSDGHQISPMSSQNGAVVVVEQSLANRVQAMATSGGSSSNNNNSSSINNINNRFVAFQTGELHIEKVEMVDLRRTYGCRLRDISSHRIVATSASSAQLILASDPTSSGGHSQGAADGNSRLFQLLQEPQLLHSTEQIVVLDHQVALSQGADRNKLLDHHHQLTLINQQQRYPYHMDWYQQQQQQQVNSLDQERLRARRRPGSRPVAIQLPCAVRAPIEQLASGGRWLFVPSTSLLDDVSGQSAIRPMPLELWAASKSLGYVTWANSNHQAAPVNGSMQPMASVKQRNRHGGNWQATFQTGSSQFVVAPTRLIIEQPRRQLSGRYIFQLDASGGTTSNKIDTNNPQQQQAPSGNLRTMCDINVIIRQPISLHIEPQIGLAPNLNDIGRSALTIDQHTGNNKLASSNWIQQTANWLGLSSAKVIDDDASGRKRRQTDVGSQEGVPITTGSNPLLDRDPARIQVKQNSGGVVPMTPIARVGDRLQLDCLGIGNPIESVRWFRNGLAINTLSSSDFQTEILRPFEVKQRQKEQQQQNKWSPNSDGGGGDIEVASLLSAAATTVHDNNISLLQQHELSSTIDSDNNNDDDDDDDDLATTMFTDNDNKPHLLSRLLIRQLQPRDLGPLMFECLVANSHGDRARSGQLVLVLEQRQLNWARKRANCPTASAPRPSSRSVLAPGASRFADLLEPEADEDEQVASESVGEIAMNNGARSLDATLGPLLGALLVEGEQAELVCPSEVGSQLQQQQHRQRIEWLKWPVDAAKSGNDRQQQQQQQQLQQKGSAGSAVDTSKQLAQPFAATSAALRNFNQLFSGDSRFVINGSSLQIRSLSRSHDEAIYVCKRVSGGPSDLAAGAGARPVHQSSLAAVGQLTPYSTPTPTLPNTNCLTPELLNQLHQASGSSPSPSSSSLSTFSSISIRIVAKPKIDPFEFSRNLEEGMRAVAVCAVISGQSPVDVTWFKDGQLLVPLDDTDDISLDQANGFSSTLTFHRIRPINSGFYTCVASNAFGAANHTSRLIVNVAPYFIEPPKSQRAYLGSNLLVNCRAGGQPSPQIRWRKLVPVGGGNSIGLAQSPTGSTSAKQVAPPLGSKALAGASNQIGGQLGSPQALLFDTNADFDQILHPGSPSQLSQSTSASSSSSSANQRQLTRYEFRIITSNSHIQILENGSMIIKEVELGDGSRYACQASNGINPSLSEVIDLQILSPAQFDVNYETISVKRDSTIKFKCQPRGDQPMQIEWFKEGNLLAISGNISSSSSSSTMSSQVGLLAVPSDESVVKYGEIAHLFVAPNSSSASLDQFQARQRHSSLILTTNKQSNAMVKQAASTTTTSTRYGSTNDIYPPAAVISSELIINSAGRSDTGTYVCQASNAYGKDELTYKLIVQEPPDAPASLQFQSIQSSSLKLSWFVPFDGNVPISHYVVEYRKLHVPNAAVGQLKSSNKVDQATGGGEWMRMVVGVTNHGNDMQQESAISDIAPPVQISSDTLQAVQPNRQQQQQLNGLGSSQSNGTNLQMSQQQQQQQTLQSVLLKQLQALSSYQIRVAAVNLLGQGAFSQSQIVQTAEEPPGQRPNDLRAQATSSSSVKVIWRGPVLVEDQAPIRGYHVSYRRFETATTSSNQLATSDGNNLDTSSRPNGDQQQQANWIATMSISANNISSSSNSNSNIPISRQLLPTNSIISSSGSGANCCNYEIQLQQLDKNTKYEIRVQAYNSMGVGPASETLVQTLKFDRPNQPILRLVAARRQAFELKWQLAGQQQQQQQPIMGFSLFYKCEYDDWQEIQLAVIYHYVIENLRCGNKYQIYLSAFNLVGRSDPSDVLSVRTEGSAPIAPNKAQFFKVINMTEAVLDMTGWQAGGCAISSFMIQFKRLHDTNWFILSENAQPFTQTDSVTIPDLIPGTWYKLLVTALNEAGSTNAEYIFGTLTLAGEHLAPLDDDQSMQHQQPRDSQHSSRPQFMGKSTSASGIWQALKQFLFAASSSTTSSSSSSSTTNALNTYDNNNGHELLLPVSCILLILVTSLASYLYYNRTASSSNSSTSSTGSIKHKHHRYQLSTTDSNIINNNNSPNTLGGNLADFNNSMGRNQAQARAASNGLLMIDKLNRHQQQQPLINGNSFNGCTGTGSCESAAGSSASTGDSSHSSTSSFIHRQNQQHYSMTGVGQARHLVQSGAGHLHLRDQAIDQSAIGATSYRLDNDEVGRHVNFRREPDDEHVAQTMLDSLINTHQDQQLLAAAASRRSATVASSNANSSSVSTQSTGFFDAATSSSGAASCMQFMMNGGADTSMTYNTQAKDRHLYVTYDNHNQTLDDPQQQQNLSPAHQILYSAQHVDLINGDANDISQHNYQQQQQPNVSSFAANSTINRQFQAQQTHHQRLASSNSFASAADLLRRQHHQLTSSIYQQQEPNFTHDQQQQQQQRQQHQQQQQEPIYQRLDKFKQCTLPTCKQYATLANFGRSQTLRLGGDQLHINDAANQLQACANQFSLDDHQIGLVSLARQHRNLEDEESKMTNKHLQQQQHDEQLIGCNRDQFDASSQFYPPPPPPPIVMDASDQHMATSFNNNDNNTLYVQNNNN